MHGFADLVHAAEKTVIIVDLHHILSLHFTDLIHFEEHGICFCACEMNKCMLTQK